MTNAAYELTKIDPVKPIDFGGSLMAQCPKCGTPNVIDTDRVSQKCRTCGMLYQVS
jgi:uncharacterized protein (DUF983 family)